MKAGKWLKTLRQVVLGRAARNVWFWLFLLWMAHSYNTGNDFSFHYGLTSSRCYGIVMAISLLLQCGLMYANNRWLVPRLLARRRILLHIIGALGLCTLTGLGTAVLLKSASGCMRVDELHHLGFTMTPISRSWSIQSLLDETLTFFISDIFWITAFTMAWYANDYVRQQRALRESEAQRLKTELAFLRNQLNPHFLFNTLNNIYGLVYLKSDAAPELILKLSSLLRYLLYETDVETIAFSRERAAIMAYAEIESLRLPDEAQLRLDLKADEDYLLPPLLWLPVLENSFKHGARLIQEPVSLDFSLIIERGQLRIASKNRFEDAAPGQAGGLGLTNLRKRLEILYPGAFEIQTERAEGVFSMLIEINLNAYAPSRPHR